MQESHIDSMYTCLYKNGKIAVEHAPHKISLALLSIILVAERKKETQEAKFV